VSRRSNRTFEIFPYVIKMAIWIFHQYCGRNYPGPCQRQQSLNPGDMDRTDLQSLMKEELIELVLRLQRPQKTSRTSSKPPSTDRKEQRARSKPGGAKPGRDGHGRIISDTPDEVVEHRPVRCYCCSAVLMADLPRDTISIHEQIDLPEVAPLIIQHRRLAVRCPSCEARVVAPVPDAAKGTPFGPRVHAVATSLKTLQSLSYARLQSAFADLFGITVSQGGLMTMLRRAQSAFGAERDKARTSSGAPAISF
jgi:transposase